MIGSKTGSEEVMKRKIFASKIFNSRICTEDTTRKEQILGYFVGPCLVYMMYTGIAGTYLTQFYTDVLGLAGGLLTMMPLVSKIISGLVSILIGRMIDRTHTAQGRARPWILGSGILLTVCGFLLYAVPRAQYQVQLAWVVVSYNLFFSLAFSTYSLSHSLMVPLSTRNTKQRDSLAMMTSMGTAMIPGMLATIIMPLLVRSIGVGDGARGAWLTVMGCLSVLAIPAVLIEYYFTLERVTQEKTREEKEAVSFGKQIGACFSDPYWLMVMGFTLVCQLCNGLANSSQLYYCNWVLGNSVSSGAGNQILVNMIGQAPMGFGIAILWPLVRKFGKRRVTIVGFAMAAAGSLLVLLAGDNMPLVLGGLLVKSTGALPTYVMSAYLAEALDHIEWRRGFRADGFSASVHSIIQTVVMGLSQTLLLAGINHFGYMVPGAADQIITQPEAVRDFFSFCYAGLPLIGYSLCAVIIVFYKLERKMPGITQELARRNGALPEDATK